MTLDKRIKICYAVFVSMKEAIGRECPAFFMVFFFWEVFSHGNEPKERFVLPAGNSDSAGCWHCIALLDGQCAGAGAGHQSAAYSGADLRPDVRLVLGHGAWHCAAAAAERAVRYAAAGASRNSDGIRNGSVWRAVRAALSDAEQEDEQDLLGHADCHGDCHACGSACRRRGKGGRDGHSGEYVHIPSVRDGVFREYGSRRGDSPDCCAAGGNGAGKSAAIAVGLEGKNGCVSQKGTGQGASKKRPLTRFCVTAVCRLSASYYFQMRMRQDAKRIFRAG